jgi:uncharacterized caspase-like protein
MPSRVVLSRCRASWLAAMCGMALVLLSASASFAERRVALIIGNSEYKKQDLTLINPKNDAEDLAVVLRALDFTVTVTTNASKRDFDRAMAQFARMAVDADAALFFYAGHALQYHGQNYLMPTDAEVEDEISLRYQMVMLDDVRASLDRASGVKIMILDACRNNPLVDGFRRRVAGANRNIDTIRGLARLDKAQGMVVAYATAADEVAADGAGRNSPFTGALLKRLQEPGLEIGRLFRRIAADVNEQTQGRQRPELYISLIDEYFLNQTDRLAWEQIKGSDDPAILRDFVTRFPTSPQVVEAQYKLQTIERVAREKELAATERARVEREAALNRQLEEQRLRFAAIEQERRERASTAPPGDEVRTEAKAESKPESKPEIKAETKSPADPRTPAPAKAEPAPIRTTEEKVAALTPDDVCKRDEERLVRLRASQDGDEAVRFERELVCERLRKQVLRIRESLVGDAPRPEAAANPSPQINAAAKPADPPRPERDAAAKPAAPSLTQEQICKRDEERLARLRVSQARDEVIRFERELGCERLRLQVVRLRESVAAE